MIEAAIMLVDVRTEPAGRAISFLREHNPRWEVRNVGRPSEAEQQLRDRPADVVLLGLDSHHAEGLAWLRALRRTTAPVDLPVIAVTTEEEERGREALSAGANDLLDPSSGRESLLARVSNALLLRRCRAEVSDAGEMLEEQVRTRTAELEQARIDALWRLAKAGEHRDEETGCHVFRVGAYCRLLGEQLGLRCEWIDRLALASPLHDIGKIAVPDAILLKPSPLDQHEWRIMQEHCVKGAGILTEAPKGLATWLGRDSATETAPANLLLTLAASIALSHHERWNGRGYPKQLTGEAIPLEARITAVADVYDVLRSSRPYKVAFDHGRTVEMILGERESHFDPSVVDAFENVTDLFATIWEHRLETPSELPRATNLDHPAADRYSEPIGRPSRPTSASVAQR